MEGKDVTYHSEESWCPYSLWFLAENYYLTQTNCKSVKQFKSENEEQSYFLYTYGKDIPLAPFKLNSVLSWWTEIEWDMYCSTMGLWGHGQYYISWAAEE
jgi:hypothetical protein